MSEQIDPNKPNFEKSLKSNQNINKNDKAKEILPEMQSPDFPEAYSADIIPILDSLKKLPRTKLNHQVQPNGDDIFALSSPHIKICYPSNSKIQEKITSLLLFGKKHEAFGSLIVSIREDNHIVLEDILLPKEENILRFNVDYFDPITPEKDLQFVLDHFQKVHWFESLLKQKKIFVEKCRKEQEFFEQRGKNEDLLKYTKYLTNIEGLINQYEKEYCKLKKITAKYQTVLENNLGIYLRQLHIKSLKDLLFFSSLEEGEIEKEKKEVKKKSLSHFLEKASNMVSKELYQDIEYSFTHEEAPRIQETMDTIIEIFRSDPKIMNALIEHRWDQYAAINSVSPSTIFVRNQEANYSFLKKIIVFIHTHPDSPIKSRIPINRFLRKGGDLLAFKLIPLGKDNNVHTYMQVIVDAHFESLMFFMINNPQRKDSCFVICEQNRETENTEMTGIVIEGKRFEHYQEFLDSRILELLECNIDTSLKILSLLIKDIEKKQESSIVRIEELENALGIMNPLLKNELYLCRNEDQEYEDILQLVTGLYNSYKTPSDYSRMENLLTELLVKVKGYREKLYPLEREKEALDVVFKALDKCQYIVEKFESKGETPNQTPQEIIEHIGSIAWNTQLALSSIQLETLIDSLLEHEDIIKAWNDVMEFLKALHKFHEELSSNHGHGLSGIPEFLDEVGYSLYLLKMRIERYLGLRKDEKFYYLNNGYNKDSPEVKNRQKSIKIIEEILEYFPYQ